MSQVYVLHGILYHHWARADQVGTNAKSYSPYELKLNCDKSKNDKTKDLNMLFYTKRNYLLLKIPI